MVTPFASMRYRLFIRAFAGKQFSAALTPHVTSYVFSAVAISDDRGAWPLRRHLDSLA